MIEGITHSPTGAIHLSVSLLAMASGLYVFLNPKGTAKHKAIGYVYVASMILVNATALMIYHLTNRFNALHFFAIVGLLTVLAGVAPAMLKKPRVSWASLHYQFMSWSYVGLISAFGAELSVRLPKKPFWAMVGISSAAISAIGGVIIFLT